MPAVTPLHLIDSIVRQTTVLIAQLSTTAGIRAPLSHVADQVFLDLAREIEAQGVGRKVVADMFGMALRTYQTKLQRLQESASQRDRTLWQAVLDYVAEEGAPTREQIERRFRHDGERAVAAVLHDLVSSGLAYSAGKGRAAMYRVTSDADRAALTEHADLESLANLVWVHVYRAGPTDLAALEAQWPAAQALLPRALERVVQDGRVERVDGPEGARYRSAAIAIPVGDELGWEAAVLDHYRAMATAIANKLQLVRDRAERAAEVGGATLTFDVYRGHPREAEVRGLLERVRGDVNALWDRVKQDNEAASAPPGRRPVRVTFYFGQNVEESDA